MKKLKVGVIGAGWIADHHVAGYLKTGKADIVAIADVKAEAARGLAGRNHLQCQVHERYADLLSNSEVDAVSICAPNRFHSELTVAAAKAGKHILCEKPFVSSPEEARNSLQAIRANQVKCAVGFHRRFNPLYMEMRRAVKEGLLGDVFFCQCDYVHNQMHLPIIQWTLKKEFNPSLFHAGGSHCVDTLRYVIGSDIVECTALVSNKSCPECETEADVVALYRFQNGAMGKVMRIAPAPIAGFEFSLEIYGTKGTFRNNRLRLDRFPNYWDQKNRDDVVLYPDWMPNNSPGPTEPWDVEVARFVDWAAGGENTGLCEALDAVKVAEACWAAVAANREGRLIKLPFWNYE